jgi:6,7-dimethyl-8-ribityllumazine synthase
MATALTHLDSFGHTIEQEANGLRFALVVSKWNSEITEALYQGCFKTLVSAGARVEDIFRSNVPGSFELVYACNKLAISKKFDAVVAIGSVIQGETKHFDFVCEAVAQGIKDINLKNEAPVIFCVLTDNTWEQSKARSGGKHGNKGVEAAAAAIEMAYLKTTI